MGHGIRRRWTFHPGDKRVNAFSVEDAQELLKRHEKRLVARGHSLPLARKKIAVGLGVAPGTLENVRRGRVKENRGFKGLCADLRAFVARELEAEIGRLRHELEMVSQSPGDVDPTALCAAESLVEQAQAVLREGRGG